MPPRASGQLDEISEAIGELKGSVGSIERYIHEHRHEVSNTSQKIDALGTKISRDMAAVEVRLETKLDNFKTSTEARLTTLENEKARREGAVGLIEGMIRNYPGVIAYLGLVFIILRANGTL